MRAASLQSNIVQVASKAVLALGNVDVLTSIIKRLETTEEKLKFQSCTLNLHFVRKFFVDTIAKFTEHCRLFIESIDVSLWKNTKDAELMRLFEERVDPKSAMVMLGYKIADWRKNEVSSLKNVLSKLDESKNPLNL